MTFHYTCGWADFPTYYVPMVPGRAARRRVRRLPAVLALRHRVLQPFLVPFAFGPQNFLLNTLFDASMIVLMWCGVRTRFPAFLIPRA